MDPRLHARDAEAEGLADLDVRQSVDVAEYEHRTASRRKFVDRALKHGA
jgi:hypothetical protein